MDADEYAAARATGASHEQVVQAHISGGLAAYVATRREGRDCNVAHADALAIATRSKRWSDYPSARHAGISHVEILAAARSGITVADYAQARGLGLAHGDAIAVIRDGNRLVDLERAIRDGLSIEEAVEWATLARHLHRLTPTGYRTHVAPLTREQRVVLPGMAPTWTSTQTALIQAVRKLAS